MDEQTTNLLNKVEQLTKMVSQLERSSIQLNMDPTTILYLKKVTAQIKYSTLAPSGVYPSGSIWVQDTGALATNKIFVSSGTAWVQVK